MIFNNTTKLPMPPPKVIHSSMILEPVYWHPYWSWKRVSLTRPCQSYPVSTCIDIGTGTRHWVGFKVWKSSTGGPMQWWVGHAYRYMVNGIFQNSIDKRLIHQINLIKIFLLKHFKLTTKLFHVII